MLFRPKNYLLNISHTETENIPIFLWHFNTKMNFLYNIISFFCHLVKKNDQFVGLFYFQNNILSAKKNRLGDFENQFRFLGLLTFAVFFKRIRSVFHFLVLDLSG